MGIERISAALLITVIMGGCSTPTEIDATKADDSLEFTGHYPRILDYKNPADIVIAYAKADDRHNPRTVWIDKGSSVYHKIYYVAWCPGPHNPIYPAKDVNELPRLIEHHCLLSGGEMRRSWCTHSTLNTPLFKFEPIRTKRFCSAEGRAYAVMVPEQKIGNWESMWIQYARLEGFQPVTAKEWEKIPRNWAIFAEDKADKNYWLYSDIVVTEDNGWKSFLAANVDSINGRTAVYKVQLDCLTSRIRFAVSLSYRDAKLIASRGPWQNWEGIQPDSRNGLSLKKAVCKRNPAAERLIKYVPAEFLSAYFK